MTTYIHKNIEVSVSLINPDWVDITGETVITAKSEFISELIEYSCAFSESFLNYEIEEFYSELGEDKEKAIKHFKSLKENIEVRNADAIIAMYEYALNNPNRKFYFEVQTENISWVIHDILHATYDAGGCTIYVDSDIEKDRIIESLRITKNQFPSLMPDFSFLEKLESEFYHRFKAHLDLEEFKYLEEY